MVNDTEVGLDERVTQTREQLAEARSYMEAMIALSGADNNTLRVIEADFGRPGPPTNLRHRIARAHAHIFENMKAQMLSTIKVTPEVVQGWAAGTLTDWFVGYTDFQEELGGQYRISYLPGAEGDGDVYEVTTAHGYDARRFRVRVTVEEA